MKKPDGNYDKIAVAGTGYIGMSLAIVLAQHNTVNAVDILPERIEMDNNRKSTVQDDYAEKYLAEQELDLNATLDACVAYADADYIIIATPTNYDPQKDFFNCSAVETAIESVLSACNGRAEQPVIVIKSTIPVGYTEVVKW